MKHGIEFRKTLVENGWRPLPARGKAVTIPKWSSTEITTEWVEQFDPTLYPNIGLRCDNLVAFDLDIDDPKLVQALLRCFKRRGNVVPLVRRREESSRILVVLRLGSDHEAPPKYYRSKKYVDGLGNEHMFEVLTGAGHQFIGYGKKGSDAYYWEDRREPANTPVSEIAAASVDEFNTILGDLGKTFDQYCTKSGYTVVREHAAEGSFAQRYVLEWGTEFTATGGSWQGAPTGPISLEKAYLALEPQSTQAYISCHLDGVREGSDSGAGRIRLDRQGDGDVIVVDFAHKIIWRLAEQEEPEGTDSYDFSDMVPSAAPPADDRFVFVPSEWVYVAAEGNAYRYSQPTRPIPIAGMRTLHGQQTIKRWISSKKHCEHTVFDPRIDPGRHKRERMWVLNQYLPPDWASVNRGGGSTATFLEFMQRLLPGKVDHSLVMDWLALKIANPWYRMHGLIMVAERQGTGRGTLVNQIISRLLGEQYCVTVDLETLLGRTYQSQYTDYLSRSLIVSIEEARDSGGDKANDWNKRKQAYEHLKRVVDPSNKKMHIVRKGLNSTYEDVFASVIIATNHSDALALDKDDRRFLVVENGVPLHDDMTFARELHNWYLNPANIATLYYDLLDRAKVAKYDPFTVAPETSAKSAMIVNNRSDLEQAIIEMTQLLREKDLPIFTMDAAYGYLHAREDFDFPPKQAKLIIGKILSSIRLADKVRREGGKDLRIRLAKGGNPVRVFALRSTDIDWARVDIETIQSQVHASSALLGETQPRAVKENA